MVTTETVGGDDAAGNGAATGLPGIAVPQPATRTASSTTTCPPDMAGTLNLLSRRAKCARKRREIKACCRCFPNVTQKPGQDPVFARVPDGCAQV
ncbi:hypothetical protein GCM10022267_30540 [Lentzea roselyniae]|uniref:Uncharacterized protein n=1 Tax=Lentzea roselyniae TaxID=531940 RepID=A0ABP7AVW5_9PSEU